MRRFVCLAAFFAGTAACYLNLGEDEHHGGGGSHIPYTGPLASVPGDLPCDVASAIKLCQACHGQVPSGGAPVALATYADLTADSLQYPGQTEAQRAVLRMQGNPTQMPPAPASPPPQTDIDALSAWIAGGYAKGTCGTQTSVCTSGWLGSFGESSQMRPGEACIWCHQSNGEGPVYTFMGTLYPTLHEPNDCVGATGSTYAGAQITVIDALGHEYAMTPNGGGNFMGSPGGFTMPFTAKVTYEGREIDMTTPQTNGDCNSCHTETGTNSAPGRITLP